MNNIKDILKKEDPSMEMFIECFEQVKANGDVAVIKFDGDRASNKYTVFISFPSLPKREIIRADGNNLKNIMKNVLKKYIELA